MEEALLLLPAPTINIREPILIPTCPKCGAMHEPGERHPLAAMQQRLRELGREARVKRQMHISEAETRQNEAFDVMSELLNRSM